MNNIIKGYKFISVGLLIGTFTQAISVNDPWGMYKLIMYFLSSILVIVGCMRILSCEKIDKLKKSLQLFVFLTIYSVGISLLYIKFGGVVSSLISVFFIVMSYKICVKSN